MRSLLNILAWDLQRIPCKIWISLYFAAASFYFWSSVCLCSCFWHFSTAEMMDFWNGIIFSRAFKNLSISFSTPSFNMPALGLFCCPIPWRFSNSLITQLWSSCLSSKSLGPEQDLHSSCLRWLLINYGMLDRQSRLSPSFEST